MLKGYIDRVFSYGFAYKYSEQGFPVGLLAGKKGFIINTQGSPAEYYDSTGMTDAMKKTSDTGIWGFCGVESVGHIFFGSIPAVDDTTRKGMLETLKNKLESLF
jgi:NAD(P)H dehydrogenase (quinone)